MSEMIETEARKPFWLKCAECAHCWIAAWLPMVASLFAQIGLGVRCPMCGATGALVAKQALGELLEPTAK